MYKYKILDKRLEEEHLKLNWMNCKPGTNVYSIRYEFLEMPKCVVCSGNPVKGGHSTQTLNHMNNTYYWTIASYPEYEPIELLWGFIMLNEDEAVAVCSQKCRDIFLLNPVVPNEG